MAVLHRFYCSCSIEINEILISIQHSGALLLLLIQHVNESVDPDQAHLDLHILFQKRIKNLKKWLWYSIIQFKGVNSYRENTKFPIFFLSPKSYLLSALSRQIQF